MNKINKRFFVSLISGAAIMACFALPAKYGDIEARQPDGTIVTIKLSGTGKSKMIHSSDGYLLTTDNEGFYVIADIDKNGLPVATDIREVDPRHRSSDIEKRIKELNQKGLSKSYHPKDIEDDNKLSTRGIGLGITKFPSAGEQRSVVILVEFSNKSFTLENPQEYYTRMLNEPGFSDYGATGSAKDYFLSNSGGRFNPQFDVYGPVQLEKTYAYYGRNTLFGDDVNVIEMVTTACEKLDEEIDFSLYDRDGDGLIDNVYFFYAGYGEADGGGANTIWPHSWDVTEATKDEYIFDGVKLDHYACSNELQNVKGEVMPDGIGSFCHEFSHVLGLPDLYSTNGSGAFTPFTWDILDQGSYNNSSRTPPNYSSFEKYALDWILPKELKSGDHILEPLSDSEDAYIVFTENENEYFLFENRQQKGNDKYIPGHGMLIWHIDFDEKKWYYNTVNNSASHQNVDIIEADNRRTEKTRDGDSFPGTSNVTEFSKDTTPAFVTWKNKKRDERIYDIRELSNGQISFKVENALEAGVESLINNNEPDLLISGNYVFSEDKCEVYTIDGKRVAVLNNSSATLISGMYICIANGKSKKIYVP